MTATPRARLLVVAALIERDGRILLSRRRPDQSLPNCWEFPGGKVEPGEDETAALVRECVEELGARVEVGERVGADVPMGHGGAGLRVYAARLVDGDRPRLIEHQQLRWLAADELYDVAWLPADEPIVAALPPLLEAPGPAT